MPKRKPEKQARTSRRANGQFAAGVSGNPKGRPPSRKYLSEALREWLAAPSETDPRSSNADTLAAVIGQCALKGDIAAIREICDRTEGRSAISFHGNLDIADSRNDERLRETALLCYSEFLAVTNDETRSRELMIENAPTLSRYLN